MATFELLYLESPHLIWLAAACLFAGASLATGIALLMGPAVAATVVTILALAGVRAGLGADLGIFAVAAAGVAVAIRLSARPAGPRPERAARPVVQDEPAPVAREPRRERGRKPAAHEMTGRLIGRIGRASSEFANGVGRVWIDGAEWAAELDAGEDGVAQGEPVRIVKVIGGVRLQVHPLAAG